MIVLFLKAVYCIAGIFEPKKFVHPPINCISKFSFHTVEILMGHLNNTKDATESFYQV